MKVMKTKESKFVNHYSHKDLNAFGIVMCDRFERRLRDFVESSIRVVVMIYGQADVYLRDGVLVTVAIKHGRKSISVDVRAKYDVDEDGQQTFKYKLENVYLGS